MAKRKAEAILLTQLRSAVEKAVKANASKGLRLEAALQVQPGIIFGRVIRDSATLEEANIAAASITKEISTAAKNAGMPTLAPVVLVVQKRITIGFLDPSLGSMVIDR